MLKQNLQQKLQQKLSPQQIQFIKLLQLNTTDFEERVEQELIENPAIDEAKNDEDNEGDLIDYNNTQSTEDITPVNADDKEFDTLSEEITDYESTTEDVFEDELFDLSSYTNFDDNDGFHLGEDLTGDEEPKEFFIATSSTFHENLKEQLTAFKLTEAEHQLAEYIIGSIDDDGYLRRSLMAMANDIAFSLNTETTPIVLEHLLKIIQTMEPAGIGARDLQECLVLQLKRRDKNLPLVKLALRIIVDFMDEFSKKHYDKLIKRLEISNEQLKEAIELISHLNPKPGENAAEMKSQYIIPDFILTNTDGNLEVTLNSRNAPELNISRSYKEALQGYEKSAKPTREQRDAVQYIKQKLDGAKWFIDSVKQRQNTLLNTMRAIVLQQYEYFLTGDEKKLKPMILKNIADYVKMDISTISRVANSKYIETDFGVIPLKFFFSEGIQTEDGEEVSNREVKKILQDAIGDEDKHKPIPDEKLMEILKEKGYTIARRTVAKYREQLNIPVARMRKEL
ncbi:MAG: RNA polymerase factor sigma-54 [Bacteroidetes bacterium]|nr:RNA polymerase factor sigma-54 [Bacteroidota bacterium]